VSRAAPAHRRVAAQLGMELRLLLRNGENLLVAFGIPLGLLVFFSAIPVLDIPEPAVAFLTPGIMALAVMGAGMVSLAIATGFERSYLVLKRLGATPLRRRELVAAKIGAMVIIQVAQIAAIAAVAGLLGWRPQLTPAAAVAASAALVLGAGAFAGIGLAMAGRLRALATLALANGLFVVLLLVSGIVFPLDRLPTGLAGAAGLLPAAALADALRSAFEGSIVAGPLAVLALWAVTAPAVAARVFRWE
jgi:ABC-2 type transport system permease protein